MMTYGLTFLLSLTAALAATPLARRAAISLDIVDHPGGRKAHHAPIPYLGGVAIYLAFIAILVAGWAAQPHAGGLTKATDQLLALVGGASLMALLGLLDDWYDLPALVKLGGQLIGAGILVHAQIIIHFNHAEFSLLETPITVLWVVGITNALNLMDNMDGLAVGTAGIGACFFILHAVLALPAQSLVATLSAALAGACFGFLYYNWSPARIFMGDAGSLFLGYILAAIALKLSLTPTTPQLARLAEAAGYSSTVSQSIHAIALLAPVYVLGLPIFDTSLVIISRLRRGVPVSQGGSDHTSHRLVGAGLSHREAVLSLYLATCALGGLSLLLTRANFKEGLAVSAITLLIAIGLIVRFEQLYAAQCRRRTNTADLTDASPTLS
ncbi:MAG TPA: MraY family glycosyltransferase [Chloroflexota bacterium]|nr:MraY family glycosyltransferase [Chloroflexota bacterium]